MTSDLVNMLRHLGDHASFVPSAYHEAADEIERLRHHIEELRDKVTGNNCACSYDEPGDVCGMHSPVVALLRTELAKVRADTIEECAKVVEDFPERILQMWERPGGPQGNGWRNSTVTDLAAAIRALVKP